MTPHEVNRTMPGGPAGPITAREVSMATGSSGPSWLGRLYALSQVGFEMAAPIGLGVFLDLQLGWLPRATVAGAVLGLVGGFAHLLLMLKRSEQPDRNGTKEPPGESSWVGACCC